jgi:ParB family chromosome partitioning protein
MPSITVPANKLRISDSNVRKDTANLEIGELAANIAAIGLINGLTVEPLTKPKGHYAVVAGGRRLRAILHNVETGVFPADWPVECKLREEGANLTEISFSENFERLDMTPADEIVTFGKLYDEGMSADQIATRFGITRRNVETRLRLTNLIPEVIEKLRDGTITLDRATALAQAPTPDMQRELLPRIGYWSADQIHRQILNNSMSSADPIARFVKADEYIAAGGTVSLDMLNPDADIWNEPSIANDIATAKITAQANAIATETGLGWVRPVLSSYVPYEETNKLHRIYIPTVTLSDEEQVQAAEMLEQLERAEAEQEAAESPEEVEAAEQKYDALEKAYDELTARTVTLTPQALSQLGRYLTLTKTGEAVLEDTLYAETSGRIDANGDFVPHEKISSIGSGRKNTSGDTDTDGPDLSARLADELKLQRRDILAAHLASNPDVAMNYMLFTLAETRMAYYSGENGTTLAASRPNDGQGEYPKGLPNEHLAAVFDQLDKTWFESGSVSARFDAFSTLEHAAKTEWAGYIMATTLVAISNYGGSANFTLQAHLARTMDIDFSAMWRPTASNYFDRVKKDITLQALEDIGGETLKSRYATAKKRDLALTAEKIFSGDAIIEPEIKEAALKWLPAAMTFALIDPDKVDPRHKGQDAPGDNDGADIDENDIEADDDLEGGIEGSMDDDLDESALDDADLDPVAAD